MASVTHKHRFKKYGGQYGGVNDESTLIKKATFTADENGAHWCDYGLGLVKIGKVWKYWDVVDPTKIVPPKSKRSRSRRVSQGALPGKGAS